MPWEDVAKLLTESPQALAIVNTKKDALDLLGALGDESALHLSTFLCGRHRQRTIQDIRERLASDQDCRVVSTQVVEAGVDLDFPMVMRAIGPLDSIIQAAGRCNRSGRIDLGRVVIFDPENKNLPSGEYRTSTQQTMSMLGSGQLDLDDPETVTEFFRRRFAATDADARGIQNFRRALDFPEVARLFRMIDQETADLIVPGYGTSEERQEIEAALHQLRSGSAEARTLLRRVRPNTVPIYLKEAPQMERSGLITQVMPGVYEWLGDYDPVTGIGGIASIDPDRLIV